MSINNKTGMRVYNGLAPIELPIGMPLSYPFPGGAGLLTIDDDLLLPLTEGQISFVQSVWVDNADNDATVQIVFDGTGQRLIIPSRSQGVYPVFVGNPAHYHITSALVAAAYNVNLIFLNVPMPHAVWST